jgi:hypothetical protein
MHGRRLSPVQHGLLGAACVFAAMLAWRDAETLRGLNVAAAALAFALAAVPETLLNAPLTRAGFIQYAANGALAVLQCLGGAAGLLSTDIRWSAIPARGAAGQLKAAGLGILVAVPVLLVFGVLLARADAAFEATLRRHLQFDAATLVQHILVLLLATWMSAGFLRLLVPRFKPLVPEEFLSAPNWSLGSLTVCIPLALTNLLFLSFIAVQLQHLFGGHAWVQNPDGPTYAEYARRGFTELAMVVSLALPLLMLSDWSLRDAPTGERRVFRGLSAATLLMLLVISASALDRMWMYLDAYGLTRLRFYTTALILWLIVLTVWFAVTILCEKRQHFMFGALVTGLIAILALNGVNPDLCIARVNLKRAAEGKKIDYEYLGLLSEDAAPAFPPAFLVKAQRATAHSNRAAVDASRMTDTPPQDIRSWNWSRSRARELMRQARESRESAATTGASKTQTQ